MAQPMITTLQDELVTSLSTSERYRVFTAAPRRIVFDVIREADSSLELATLASRVRENADEDMAIPDGDALLIELHHIHLPIMDEAGILEYDIRTRTAYPVSE